MTPQLARDPQMAEYILQFPASPCEKIASALCFDCCALRRGALAIAGMVMKFRTERMGLTRLDQPNEAPKKDEKA